MSFYKHHLFINFLELKYFTNNKFEKKKTNSHNRKNNTKNHTFSKFTNHFQTNNSFLQNKNTNPF